MAPHEGLGRQRLMEPPVAPTPPFPVERYLPWLRLLARQLRLNPRLRSRFDDSDVVGETLVKACREGNQFRGVTEAEFMKWLSEILHNTFRDMVRRELAGKRDPGLEAPLQAIQESSVRIESYLAAADSSPDERAERKELLLRIADAVDRLPADQRDVVIQRDFLDSPVAEIAAQTGRTEKSVAGLLLRGRRKLRELLADFG
jgi:RNA polymerase sigma-70 factor (ECF subfamily)